MDVRNRDASAVDRVGGGCGVAQLAGGLGGEGGAGDEQGEAGQPEAEAEAEAGGAVAFGVDLEAEGERGGGALEVEIDRDLGGAVAVGGGAELEGALGGGDVDGAALEVDALERGASLRDDEVGARVEPEAGGGADGEGDAAGGEGDGADGAGGAGGSSMVRVWSAAPCRPARERTQVPGSRVVLRRAVVGVDLAGDRVAEVDGADADGDELGRGWRVRVVAAVRALAGSSWISSRGISAAVSSRRASRSTRSAGVSSGPAVAR
jgi:hypothetical protein